MAEQNNKADEIYSLIVPMLSHDLLVPNVSVAELVPMGKIDQPKEKHPEWFLGALDWRGERVPLLSFELANGEPQNALTPQSRVAIFNTLSDNSELPFLGIVVQGIPRLTHIKSEELSQVEDGELGKATLARVNYHNMYLDIPNLDYLESLVQ